MIFTFIQRSIEFSQAVMFQTRPSALGMSDPIMDHYNEPASWDHYVHVRRIHEIWSTYQKYGQHTTTMVNILVVWLRYQIYGQNSRSMVNIPEVWSTFFYIYRPGLNGAQL